MKKDVQLLKKVDDLYDRIFKKRFNKSLMSQFSAMSNVSKMSKDEFDIKCPSLKKFNQDEVEFIKLKLINKIRDNLKINNSALDCMKLVKAWDHLTEDEIFDELDEKTFVYLKIWDLFDEYNEMLGNSISESKFLNNLSLETLVDIYAEVLVEKNCYDIF